MDLDRAFRETTFFRALSTDAVERIRPYANLRALDRGERFWQQGDASENFAFVVKGRVKLFTSEESGHETILEMPSCGDMLCGSAVFSYVPFECNAAAMDADTWVLSVPRREVLEAVERNPTAAWGFMRETSCRTMQLCKRVDQLGKGLARRRIATLILRLAERTGQRRDAQTTWIPVPLSRQDLADLCATTVETAIRVMSQLERDNVVATSQTGFLLQDRGALDQLASSGST